ncbi:hypothetical protein LTR56_001679 [Elasticomyces elasticus]|nr:hypothetical protein LTR56_001679 [Elasticomyces elasticus]KAK3667270.1 hypothetical protein LTR22_001786 [Elasticomyces elasticus]KAK4932652.1 hypothetical protein LTR49_001076 [Elasticomyces elasticus]KAK5769673.1 hypothetical protein LTS12_000123 [Elasticomyces elasticus]
MAIKTFAFAFYAATTFAIPLTIRQTGLTPGAAATNDNIQGWQDDIANVNGFLNVAAAGTQSAAQLEQTAADLLLTQPGAATDEPNRLMALAGLVSSADTTAMAAVSDLMVIFGGVLGNLTTIVNAGDDMTVITGAVNLINDLRCNFVLPDIDQVFAGAVANNPGATAATTSGPNLRDTIITDQQPTSNTEQADSSGIIEWAMERTDFTEHVKLAIGSGEVGFSVHKDLICRHSPAIATTLAAASALFNSTDPETIVKLPEFAPGTFATYLVCLYHETVDLQSQDSADEERWHELVDVYIVADTLQDVRSANVIMDECTRYIDHHSTVPWSAIMKVFDKTTQDCPLRRLIVDSRLRGNTWEGTESDWAMAEMPKAFFADFFAAYAKTMKYEATNTLSGRMLGSAKPKSHYYRHSEAALAKAKEVAKEAKEKAKKAREARAARDEEYESYDEEAPIEED